MPTEPPNIEQLRAAMDYGWKDWHVGDSLRDADIAALDTILGAARWLLSLADEGGRLAVEAPCEHGFVGSHWQDDPKPDDPKNQFHCPGGSRRVVWPKEEA